MRITVNGRRAETTSGRDCDPSSWNNIAGRLKGTKEEVRSFNAYLDNLQAQVYEAHHLLTAAGHEISADSLRNRFLGKEEKSKMLLDVFKDHNKKVAALVGEEYASGTLGRYEISFKHTKGFYYLPYTGISYWHPDATWHG